MCLLSNAGFGFDMRQTMRKMLWFRKKINVQDSGRPSGVKFLMGASVVGHVKYYWPVLFGDKPRNLQPSPDSGTYQIVKGKIFVNPPPNNP
jgi:hypothetical protein